MSEKYVRFGGSGGTIFNMLIFITGVAGLITYALLAAPSDDNLIINAFNANRALNGLILFVLFMGIIYNLRQAATVGPSVRWVNAFRDSVDPGRTKLPRPPALIGAMSRILLDADKRGGRLSQASSRAILDSIGTRIDEGRELGRYGANLLVFLGLLGTFWGLLQTVNAVADTISGLSSTNGAEDAVSQLIANLKEPLSGMGTAFSSSLFGLGGSLIIGYLDIQAGRAQNRFYSDLEDWLSGISTHVTTDSKGQAIGYSDNEESVKALYNIEAAIKVLMSAQNEAHIQSTDQMRAEIRALGRMLVDGTPPPQSGKGKRS